MAQIAFAVESQAFGKLVTISVGWGWSGKESLFGVISQKTPDFSVRRYGLVVLGLFATIQYVDVAGARKILAGEQIKRTSSVHGPNVRAGAARR